jgi:hypothetical protein
MDIVTSAMKNFKVKDVEEVLKVFKTLGYIESNIYNDCFVIAGQEKALVDDLVLVNEETSKAVAVFVDDEEIYYNLEGKQIEVEPTDKYKHLYWFEYLQEKLLNNEQIAVITEISYEKLHYADSYTVIISKKGIYKNSTSAFISKTIEKIEK